MLVEGEERTSRWAHAQWYMTVAALVTSQSWRCATPPSRGALAAAVGHAAATATASVTCHGVTAATARTVAAPAADCRLGQMPLPTCQLAPCCSSRATPPSPVAPPKPPAHSSPRNPTQRIEEAVYVRGMCVRT